MSTHDSSKIAVLVASGVALTLCVASGSALAQNTKGFNGTANKIYKGRIVEQQPIFPPTIPGRVFPPPTAGAGQNAQQLGRVVEERGGGAIMTPYADWQMWPYGVQPTWTAGYAPSLDSLRYRYEQGYGLARQNSIRSQSFARIRLPIIAVPR